jgi:hypothetical protein
MASGVHLSNDLWPKAIMLPYGKTREKTVYPCEDAVEIEAAANSHKTIRAEK